MADFNPTSKAKLSFFCNQDWERLVPCKNGRFCPTCQKTVVDFTGDKPLDFSHLQSQGAICGRFLPAQVALPTCSTSFIRKAVTSLLIGFGLKGLAEKAAAQSIPPASLTQDHPKNKEPYFLGMVAEVMPVYKHGAEKGMMKFLSQNIQYPSDNPEGLVVVTFTVDTNGSVKDLEVVKGLTAGANQEAVRVANLLEFIPATQNGKTIPVRYTLPIRFSNAKPKARK